jgi:hypothetical protein
MELTSEEQRCPQHVESQLRVVQLKSLIGLLTGKVMSSSTRNEQEMRLTFRPGSLQSQRPGR